MNLKKILESIFILIIGLIIGLIFGLIYGGIDREIIAIIIAAVFAMGGYFITHYLNLEQRKKEQKIEFYKQLSCGIRVFIKESEKKDMLVEAFEKTYYGSWPYISTIVYTKLLSYLDSYKEYTKDRSNKQNKEKYGKDLKDLMKAIRDEITQDNEVEFRDIDFRFK